MHRWGELVRPVLFRRSGAHHFKENAGLHDAGQPVT
jgi:hypothetical protein